MTDEASNSPTFADFLLWPNIDQIHQLLNQIVPQPSLNMNSQL